MKRVDFSSLRVRLLILVLLASIPAMLFIASVALSEREAATARIQAETIQLSQLSTASQEEWIEGTRQLLVSLAQLPAVRNRDPAACSGYFAEIHKSYSRYANIYAVAPDGAVFCSALPMTGTVSTADRTYFQRAVSSGNFSIGDYQAAGRVSNLSIIVAAYPVYDDDGNLLAVVAASHDLAWLNELAEKMQLPKNASFIVIDGKGTILARYPDPEKWVGHSVAQAGMIKTILSQKDGTAQLDGVDGVTRMFAFSPVYTKGVETGIFTGVGISESLAFARINGIFVRNLAVMGVVILLMLLLAWFGSDALILRPVNALLDAVRRLGAGEPCVSTGVPYNQGEVGELTRAFDEMAGSLQEKEARRKKAEQSAAERLTRIEALADIDQAVMGFMPVPQLLATVLEKVPEKFGADAVAITLLHDDAPKTKSFVMRLPDGSIVTDEAFMVSEELMMWFVQQKEPVLVYDLEDEPRVEVCNDILKGMNFAAYMGVPMLAHGKTTGIMHMLTCSQHEFTREEIDFFFTLACQAAIAVDYTSLYSNTRRRSEATEKMISKSLEIAMRRYKSIERELCTVLSDTFGEEKLAYYPYDEATNTLTLGCATGFQEEVLEYARKEFKFSPGDEKGIVGLVASTRQTIYLPDCVSDGRWVNIDPGIHSAYFVPMVLGEQLFGVVGAFNEKQYAYTPDDRQLFSSLTNYAALAQKNAGLLELMRLSEEKYRNLMQNAGDAIIILNEDGTPVDANKKSSQLFGYTRDEMLALNVSSLFPESEQGRVIETFTGINETGSGFLNDVLMQRKDGTSVPVDISGGTVEFGGHRCLHTICRDISSRKKAQELQIQKEALEYASKAKSEFLTSMSHELRTPLNAVLGFSQLLNDGVAGELNEKQKRYVGNINTSGNFLLNLINDILDLSKVEAGKIELNREQLSLPQTIDESITLIKEKAMKHNIKIEKELDPGLTFIEADKQRVKQILFNLLSNAVKFSREEGGTVTISSKKNGEMAEISVADTGIGIKPENMGKLFGKFEQLDKGISAKYGGTGLGLSICKQLSELHEGRIWAQSEYGEGSTFTFALPIIQKKEGK